MNSTKTSSAERFALVQDLLKKSEPCICSDCGNEHVAELGIIDEKQARALLKEINENKTEKKDE